MSKEQFDKHIDALSREAAEHYTQPFNEESWQKMEALLEEDQPKRRPIIFWWWLLPIVLIGGGILFYIQYNGSSSNTTFDTASVIKQSSQEINRTSAQTADINKQNPLDNKKEVSNKEIQKSGTEKKESDKAITNILNKKLQLNSTGITQVNNVPLNKSSNISNELGNNALSKNNDIAGKKNNHIPPVESNKAIAEHTQLVLTKEIVRQDDNVQSDIEIKKDLLADTNQTKQQKKLIIQPLNTSSTDTVSNMRKKADVKKPTKQSGFEFGFFTSLDVSTVKFKKKDKLSPAFGLLIGYQVSLKWSFATGIGIAQKLYRADSIDYSNPYYLPRNSIMTDIKADCRVLEIPLNVQYLFNQQSANSWSAVAGLSNYFMLSEQYVYEFTENGVPKTTAVLYKKKNNHILSVLNFAVAYRRNINKKFSWQLTPYIKLPLSGIGEGRVQLASFGLMGSLHLSAKK